MYSYFSCVCSEINCYWFGLFFCRVFLLKSSFLNIKSGLYCNDLLQSIECLVGVCCVRNHSCLQCFLWLLILNCSWNNEEIKREARKMQMKVFAHSWVYTVSSFSLFYKIKNMSKEPSWFNVPTKWYTKNCVKGTKERKSIAQISPGERDGPTAPLWNTKKILSFNITDMIVCSINFCLNKFIK